MNKEILLDVATRAYLDFMDRDAGEEDWWVDYPEAGVEANVFLGSLVLEDDEHTYITLFSYNPLGHNDKAIGYFYVVDGVVREDDRE